MKTIGLKYALIIALCALMLPCSAQAPVKPETTKVAGKDMKEFRREKEKEYLEWERTYFNSPGKWFLNIKTGYGFPMQTLKAEAITPFEFLGKSDLTITPNGQVSDKLILNSDGTGPRIAIGIGKMFNRFVGFELELGYVDEVAKQRASINTPTLKTSFESDLFELYADPLVYFQSPNMNNFYIYGRLGPHIPFWGKPRAYGKVDDREGALISGILFDPYQDILESLFGLPFTSDLLSALDYHGTLTADSKIYLQQDPRDTKINEILRGIGINASFGFRYQATPIVSVFTEARIMGFNVSVAQAIIEDLDAEITILGGAVSLLELNEEGGQILGNPVTRAELQSLLDVIYVNELDEDSNNPILNPDTYSNFKSREELAPRLSVMSIGFQVGVQVNIPGKHITYRSKKKN